MVNQMSSTELDNNKSIGYRWGYFILLCTVCILVNLGGSQIAILLNVSLYLDSAGTILAAILGGYLPGITVGLFTNFIRGFVNDSSSIYFSSINIAIAVCTTFFWHRGFQKKIWTSFVVIALCAIIGGGLGSVLMWFLGLSAYDTFWNGLVHDLGIDFLDKLISFAFVYVVYRGLPDKWISRLRFDGWQQKPLTREAQKQAKKGHCRTISLRYKLLFVLMFACISISVAATSISMILYRKAATAEYTRVGQSVAGVMSGIIDPDKVDDYLKKGEKAEGYKETKDILYSLRDNAETIEYLYVWTVEKDGCHVVFDLDTEYDKGFETGTVIPFDESFYKVLPDLLAGKAIDPIVTDDTYGWLLTVYNPIYDETGNCVCYACVDIRMSTLIADETVFFTKMLSLFLGFFVTVVAVGLWLAEYNLLLPINTIANATDVFAYNSEDARTESVERINELDIRTGDEIENLYHAITETTNESMRYVANLQEQKKAIEHMQNGLIIVLADMVESRDQNTGQHVRKTAEYTRIIMEQLRKEGLYTDELTDEFVYDVYHSAPLHDVGKITIPDAILNKPGRLDDREFEIMRTHTLAGRDIISRIIDIAPDSEYMKEARNLAAYHHERWDGKGYPEGLSGTDIPLSARIMAVADVFDALYSKRSYKAGFTFEKSMSIIEEGIGTQFDPDVANAFIHAGKKVYETAMTLQNGVEE